MTLQEQLNIINKFDLQIEEIEPLVYKVLNSDKEIKADILGWDLEEDSLITSPYIKVSDHYYTYNIYYIILDNKQELRIKYCNKAKEEQRKATIMYYSIKQRELDANGVGLVQ